MTIRECYGELGLDFDAVLSRLVNEKLVQKFALKFLDDPSFQNLKDALDSKDVETAFRAAHTLKGVCLNLGFDRLYEVSAELTESSGDAIRAVRRKCSKRWKRSTGF